jgi:hypothetical protein
MAEPKFELGSAPRERTKATGDEIRGMTPEPSPEEEPAQLRAPDTGTEAGRRPPRPTPRQTRETNRHESGPGGTAARVANRRGTKTGTATKTPDSEGGPRPHRSEGNGGQRWQPRTAPLAPNNATHGSKAPRFRGDAGSDSKKTNGTGELPA